MTNELFAEDDVDLEKELTEAQDADDQAKKEVETETQTESVEAKDAQTEQDSEPDKEEKKETPRVPLPELQAERKKRQAAEADAAEQREKFARVDERLNLLSEKLKTPETSYDEDPGTYLREQGEKTQGSVSQLQDQIKQFTEQGEVHQQQNNLVQAVTSSEMAFRQEHNDYDDAIKHLRAGRDREFQAMGITDSAQREQALTQDAMQLAHIALQNGTSPAEMAYKIAQERGYQIPAKSTKGDDKLASIEKGQEKSKSLSNAGGSEERIPDAEALANMDDREFDEAMKSGSWDKIMSKS